MTASTWNMTRKEMQHRGLKGGDVFKKNEAHYRLDDVGRQRRLKRPFNKDGTMRKPRERAGLGSKGGCADAEEFRLYSNKYQRERTARMREENPEKFYEQRERDYEARRKKGPRKLTEKQKLRRLELNRLRHIPIANETPEQRAKRLAYKKDYRERNKNNINEKARESRVNDIARHKDYEAKGLSKRKLKLKNDPAYRAEQTEKRSSYSRRYLKESLHGNIAHKLRSRVSHAVRRSGRNKSASTMALLGCSIPEFQEYFKAKFTEGMTWQKFLAAEIHLDHIRPCASFDLTKESEQRKCCHYSNLQPLWAKDNYKKGARYDRTKTRSRKKV